MWHPHSLKGPLGPIAAFQAGTNKLSIAADWPCKAASCSKEPIILAPLGRLPYAYFRPPLSLVAR